MVAGEEDCAHFVTRITGITYVKFILPLSSEWNAWKTMHVPIASKRDTQQIIAVVKSLYAS